MGYTHYWRNKGITEARWGIAIHEAKRVAVAMIDLIAGGDGKGRPEIGDGLCFNGKGELRYQAFEMPAAAAELPDWSFCKTDQRPYDVVVCAVLATLRYHAGGGGGFVVESDGTPEEWEQGLVAAHRATGEFIGLPMTAYMWGEKFRLEYQPTIRRMHGEVAVRLRTLWALKR